MIRYRVVVRDSDSTVLTTVRQRAAEEQRTRMLDPDHFDVLTEDVEIVGRFGRGTTDGRVLWADGRTSAVWEIDETATVAQFAEVASNLLATIYGSDSPSCTEVGGPLLVAAIAECVTTVVARDPRSTRGGYQSPRVEKLDVVLADGSRRTWYAASVGYGEGYLYVLTASYETAVAGLAGYDAQLEADPRRAQEAV